MPTEQRVARFGRSTLVEQFVAPPLGELQQEFKERFVDETYSFFPFELILLCKRDAFVLCDELEGRIAAGIDVGRTRRADRRALPVQGDQAENLSRDFPQVVGENFTNGPNARGATDFKIDLQLRDVTSPPLRG